MTRTRIVFALGLVLLASCADAGTEAPKPSGPAQARTAPGAPKGDPTSATIGPQGGEVATPDGRLAIRVPAGAVDADTEMSVQPVENLAPGGRGAAYRLSPHGVVFSKPVDLVFRYGSDDLAGTAAEALLVTFQDDDGRWWIPRRPALDAVAKEVRLATTHFSDWSLIAGISLSPSSGNVRTGRTQALQVEFCGEPPEGDDLVPAFVCRPPLGILDQVSTWRVNGVDGGDMESGKVAAAGPHGAVYTAAGHVPNANPVAVSAKLDFDLSETWLVANLEVIEEGCGEFRGKPVPCEWSGETSVEGVVGEGMSIEARANSTWRFERWESGQAGVAHYLPVAGEVTVVSSVVSFCTATVQPASHPIGSADHDLMRRFAIDFAADPPRLVSLGGQTQWPAVVSLTGELPCVPGTMNDDEFTITWVDDHGVESDVIDGAISGECRLDFPGGFNAWTWSFHAH